MALAAKQALGVESCGRLQATPKRRNVRANTADY